MLGNICVRNGRGILERQKTQKEASYSCLVSELGPGYVNLNILWSRPAHTEMQ